MRIIQVTVGMDRKRSIDYQSEGHSIILSATIESEDKIDDVETALEIECMRHLDRICPEPATYEPEDPQKSATTAHAPSSQTTPNVTHVTNEIGEKTIGADDDYVYVQLMHGHEHRILRESLRVQRLQGEMIGTFYGTCENCGVCINIGDEDRVKEVIG